MNHAEKMGELDSASNWMQYRELRNIEAHTYESDLSHFLLKLRSAAPAVLELIKRFPR